MLPRNVGASLVLVCAKLAVPLAVSMDSPSPSMAFQPGDDRHVLTGDWEYVDIDGAADRLIFDERGTVAIIWIVGGSRHTLIDHTWQGMWF